MKSLRQTAMLLFVLAPHGGWSQAPIATLEPVHWTAEAFLPSLSQAGAQFTVLLHAAIDSGWHLYALQEKDAFPLATEIALTSNTSAELLRVAEEKPRHSLDPDSHVLTAWFAQSATFTLLLGTTSRQPPHDLQALVRYQACNDRMCLPLKTMIVPILLHTAH